MDHRQQDVDQGAPGEHTVDEAEGRSEQPAGLGVYLLGVEAHVVGQAEQLFHEFRSLAGPAGAGHGVDQPERAGEEGALASGEAVLARVAVQEGAVAELSARRRSPHSPEWVRTAATPLGSGRVPVGESKTSGS